MGFYQKWVMQFFMSCLYSAVLRKSNDLMFMQVHVFLENIVLIERQDWFKLIDFLYKSLLKCVQLINSTICCFFSCFFSNQVCSLYCISIIIAAYHHIRETFFILFSALYSFSVSIFVPSYTLHKKRGIWIHNWTSIS